MNMFFQHPKNGEVDEETGQSSEGSASPGTLFFSVQTRNGTPKHRLYKNNIWNEEKIGVKHGISVASNHDLEKNSSKDGNGDCRDKMSSCFLDRGGDCGTGFMGVLACQGGWMALM